MTTTPTQDKLSGIPTSSTTSGTALTPFAAAVMSGTNDATDVVTVYVLNDNAAAGTLDASALPAGVCIAPAGGTLAMISGSVATVQAALRLLRFDAASLTAGVTQSAHLTLVISNTADGVSSARAIMSSSVQNKGINVAVQGLPAATTIADSAGFALFPQAAIVSLASDSVSVTLSLGDSALGAFDAAALSGVSVSNGANGTITLAGSAAAVGSGLQQLRFVPNSTIIGTTAREIVTVVATDQVNGTHVSDTVAVSITGSRSAVSLGGTPATATVAGGATMAPFGSLLVQNGVSGAVVATVTLATPADGSLDLSALPSSGANGVTSSLSPDNSSLTLTGTASAVQSDLQALRFMAANPAVASLTETINLVVATAASGSANLSETLTIYPDVQLSGPSTTVQATLTLSDATVAAFDQAAIAQLKATPAVDITVSGNGASLRIVGSAATVATALRAVKLVATTPASGVRSQEQAVLTLSAASGNASYMTTILVDGPALQAVSMSQVAATLAGIAGTTLLPFGQAVIGDPNQGDTVTVTVASSIAGVFDATTLGGATLSADGMRVTVKGSATAVASALRGLAVHLPQTGAGTSLSLTVQLATAAGTSLVNAPAVTETIQIKAPAYSSDTGSTATGHIFSVSSDPTTTATIDLSANPNTGIVVFGGDAALKLRAANTTLVLNGANQTGAVSLTSLGNDVVWVGAAPVDCTAGGHDRFVLGNAKEVSSTVTLHGGTAADTSEFDIWGNGSEVQTITTDGSSTSTVFAGASAMNFTGGRSTVVLNGVDQTGAVTIHSLGDDAVWAGTATLNFFEGAGSDTVLLTGSATTTIHGATSTQTGTTTVMSFGSTGQFTYDGGDKAANLALKGGTNTVHAGSAAQTVSMSGGGSLLVADGAPATGAQQITMTQGSTASLQFLGGANPAKLVLGAGTATIDAGMHTSVTGGTGAATIDLSHAVGAFLAFDGSLSGAVDITGFDPSRASVTLSHVTGSAVQNGSLVVSFSDGNHAIVQNDTDPNHAGISFG